MRRYFYSIIASTALLLIATAASAQTGQLRGRVWIQQADGTKVPAAGAQVDVYRTDLPGKYPSKANKNGEFVYAGLPFVGTYSVAVSAPNAQPAIRSGVKAGRDIDVEIVMMPGDGRRFTEAEVKSGAADGGGASSGNGKATAAETEAEKARREEAAKIAESNKKIENANQVVGDSFKSGNAALTAKNYDEAVRQYDTGIAADPDHPGIPSLLTNKSVALRMRAVDRFNTAVQSKDEAAKTSGVESAKADFKASAEAATQAVDFLKKQTAPTDPVESKQAETNKYFALAARAESMRLFVTKVDTTKANEAMTAYQEYMAAEPDAVKKAKAQYDLAQMLFDAGAYDLAKVEYEKILAAKPDDPDALANMGLILFNSGATKEGEGNKEAAKAMYQQAANYLQQFVDKAPDAHRFKADAKAVLEALKSQQNVQAEKPAARPRPGRKP